MPEFVITIARGFGSGGRTIGRMLAERLDINYYDGELIRLASEESGINVELFGKADEHVKTNLFKRYNRSYGYKLIPPDSSEFSSDDNLFNYQAKIIKGLAEKGNSIIVGRCADHVLRDVPNVLRVFIHAPMDFCIKQVTDMYSVTEREAIRQIERIDRARSTYYRYYTGNDLRKKRNLTSF